MDAVFPEGIPSPPPDDFAAEVQWQAWQNRRRSLEQELREARLVEQAIALTEQRVRHEERQAALETSVVAHALGKLRRLVGRLPVQPFAARSEAIAASGEARSSAERPLD